MAVWAALLVLVAVGGRRVDLALDAPPFVGVWEWRPSLHLVPAVVVALLVVALGPGASRTARWPALLVGSGVVAAAWAVALALGDGPDALAAPLANRFEYVHAVPAAEAVGLGEFIATYVERLGEYPVHVESHPPGMVLVLWALQEVGAGDLRWAAGLVIVAGSSAVPAALAALADVAGRPAARRAAPFLVLAPAAVWTATSADALFAGVTAWAVALVVLASGRRRLWAAVAMAVAGGVAGGAALHLTYGALPALAPAGIVVLARRRWATAALATAGTLTVVALATAAGFRWWDGLEATRQLYHAGIAADRPHRWFLLVNLAALAAALGPAWGAAVVRLRDRSTWLLVGGALFGVAVANLSGVSKGEVERIWLPFLPWLLLATAALGAPAAPRRGWLVAQSATALLLQASLRSPW